MWAWQDPLGTWHTYFSEDPEEFYPDIPPDETYYVLKADADRLAEALTGLLSITVDPTLLAPEQREEVKGARAALAAYEGGES